MRYRSLEDYISTLSESEREQHKQLIAECRERDAEITKNCDELKKNIEMWITQIKKNAETMLSIEEYLHKFKTSLSDPNAEIPSDVRHCEQLIPNHYPISLN
jgi:uncharacterized coiled-coil DUF342 family protein